MDLKNIGDLGRRFENAGSVKKSVNGFIAQQLGLLRSSNKCYEDYTYVEPLANRATVNVTWDYHLFSVGDASFFREVNCQGGNCNFRFYIRDMFKEPLGIPLDLPQSSPYRINYEFTKARSCY